MCAKLTPPPLTLQEIANIRWQADMCDMYKNVNGLYKSNPFLFLAQSQHKLRGHSRKLEKKHCRTSLHQNFFSYRVVNDWNGCTRGCYLCTIPTLLQTKTEIPAHWCRGITQPSIPSKASGVVCYSVSSLFSLETTVSTKLLISDGSGTKTSVSLINHPAGCSCRTTWGVRLARQGCWCAC